MRSTQSGPASTAIFMKEAPCYGVNDPAKASCKNSHVHWFPLKRRRDIKVDWSMTFLAILVPCALFSLIIVVCSFALFEMFFYAVSLSVICVVSYLTYLKMKAGAGALWLSFLLVTCTLAVHLGGVLGKMNYIEKVRPYQEVLRMNRYTNLDPTGLKGNALLDAGRITFVPDAAVDASRTMGFINSATYCVAPIILSSSTTNGTRQDLWAVGVDCCGGGLSADFKCGDVDKPEAHSALRLMHESERGFYRLAVQQAAFSFKLEVVHPSFFHWVRDPDEMMATFKDDSMSNLMSGIFAHFIFQISLVVLCVVGTNIFLPH